MRLLLAGHITTGDSLLDTGLQTLKVVATNEAVRLYAATGAKGGITAWDLVPGTAPREIDRQYFPDWMQDDITGLAGLRSWNGTVQLVLGSAASTQVLGYGLDAAGRIGSVLEIGRQDSAAGRVTGVVTNADGDVLYLADAGQGALNALGAADPVGPAFAITGKALLATTMVGTREMLLMADPGQQAVTSFEIGATGWLTPRGTMGLEQGLGISVPTALVTVRAHGQDWALVAAAQSGSISVLRIDPAGGLTPTDHIIDTRTTRFGAVQDMAVVETEGRAFVLAGGGDDGLSLFALLPDGRLVHLQSLAHDIGAGLMDVSTIAAARVGNEIQILVASDDQAGLARFTVPLFNLGEVVTGPGVLSGTSGDDILMASEASGTLTAGDGDDILVGGTMMIGGAGADIFVARYAPGLLRIVDFAPGSDRLDLSDFPMLRGPEQLDLRATATGARITWRDSVIEITSASRAPISPEALFGPAFDWPDRVLVLGAQSGVQMRGTPAGEFLGGTERADTITGEGGADSLWARGGNDVLNGGPGPDSLGGQDGDDTLMGEEGNDMLAGGNGDDRLLGGAGQDGLWGAGDDDQLFGEDGNDTLGGGPGDDEIDGAAGADELWGGPGNDSLQGGDGNDSLGGFTGDDTLRGGDGADELWGSAGLDMLYGGNGNDMLGGGPDDDRVQGDGGDDLLFGGPGQDTVLGGLDDDQLYGAAGDDQIMGGLGDDSLWGGAGDDWLSGGAGADVFYFSADPGNDQIADFEPGADTIRIYDASLSFSTLEMRQVAGNVQMSLGDSVLTFSSLQIAELSATDFVFG